MTPAQKKAYNEKYYREHSNYWKDFYSKGRLVGRQKNVTESGKGVHRRGEGLGTGPVGSGSNKKRSVDATGAVDSWANLVSQTGTPVQSYAYNDAVGIQNHGPIPEFTAQDIEQYMTSALLDNLVNSLSKTKSKTISAGKNFIANWKSGATSVKNLFKKRR